MDIDRLFTHVLHHVVDAEPFRVKAPEHDVALEQGSTDLEHLVELCSPLTLSCEEISATLRHLPSPSLDDAVTTVLARGQRLAE